MLVAVLLSSVVLIEAGLAAATSAASLVAEPEGEPSKRGSRALQDSSQAMRPLLGIIKVGKLVNLSIHLADF
jgi:hypothetical protein